MEESARLKQIRLDKIRVNPDNPRIAFRQEELDALFTSINKIGVQVPVSVYEDDGQFTLIDGERRWRTCNKLNLKTIPAIVQSKPDELENLLLMFNIHALREQWDYFTIANKLTKIINLLTSELNREPNEVEISEATGLGRGVIRRCRLLIDLPQRFKQLILEEIQKPKKQQKFSEDLFIELERNLKTVSNNFPETIDNIDDVRDNLISKYINGIITNVTDFRMIGKIATSPRNVDFPPTKVRKSLQDIFTDNETSISQIYHSTVGGLYEGKSVISNFDNALYYVENLNEDDRLDEGIRKVLNDLLRAIEKVLNV